MLSDVINRVCPLFIVRQFFTKVGFKLKRIFPVYWSFPKIPCKVCKLNAKLGGLVPPSRMKSTLPWFIMKVSNLEMFCPGSVISSKCPFVEFVMRKVTGLFDPSEASRLLFAKGVVSPSFIMKKFVIILGYLTPSKSIVAAT